MARNLRKAEPAISVVLPTYNRSALLRRSIGSVLAQTYTDFELLVVDDCSQEDIQAVVDGFADTRVRYIRRPQNGGAPSARNTGLAHAKGEFIAFQDSDDEWFVDKLETQIKALQACPDNVVMVICGMAKLSPSHVATYPGKELLPAGNKDYSSVIKQHAVAFTQTWLVRKHAFDQLDGFEEGMKIWDDWEMLLRLSQLGSIEFLPQTLVLMHHTDGSLSTNIAGRVSDLSHMLQKYEGDHRLADRRFLARLHYLYGRFLFLTGEHAQARRQLRHSLSLEWFELKPLAFLMLSALSPQLVKRFLSIPPEVDA